MTAPGDLNRRLVLEAPVETDDGAGGVSQLYAPVAALWAEVVPLSAGEDNAADSLGATLRHRITLRMRRDVTLRHRLRDGEHVYRLRSLRPSADRRFIEIDAEERQD